MTVCELHEVRNCPTCTRSSSPMKTAPAFEPDSSEHPVVSASRMFAAAEQGLARAHEREAAASREVDLAKAAVQAALDEFNKRKAELSVLLGKI